jgi:hypothetical protein
MRERQLGEGRKEKKKERIQFNIPSIGTEMKWTNRTVARYPHHGLTLNNYMALQLLFIFYSLR